MLWWGLRVYSRAAACVATGRSRAAAAAGARIIAAVLAVVGRDHAPRKGIIAVDRLQIHYSPQCNIHHFQNEIHNVWHKINNDFTMPWPISL